MGQAYNFMATVRIKASGKNRVPCRIHWHMSKFAAHKLVPDNPDNNLLGNDRGMDIIKGKRDFKFMVFLDIVSADDCEANAAHGDIFDKHGAPLVV
jgi:hypothetical protein